MKKETYEAPKVRIEIFDAEDVVTASDPDGEGWTDFYPFSLDDNSSGR